MADDGNLLAKLHELVAAQAEDLKQMRRQIAECVIQFDIGDWYALLDEF